MAIKFNSDGLVVALAVDAYTNEVLMQAYMNREAFDLTLSTGKAYYYSRSRGKLWLKGETSGHFQKVIEVLTDCDSDCVLLRVVQEGAACHTGNRSCFYTSVKEFEKIPNIAVLQKDINTIASRRESPVLGSYTNYLLDKGVEKICKKIGADSLEYLDLNNLVAIGKEKGVKFCSGCFTGEYPIPVVGSGKHTFDDV